MKTFLLVVIVVLLSSCIIKEKPNMKAFTEKEVLNELDKAYNDSDPLGSTPEDSPYHFFLDLEPPYTIIGGSKIHLYADSASWAVIFETNGYNTRGGVPEIELVYVGNCISFEYKDPWGNTQNSNFFTVGLMTPEEIEQIRNKEGSDYEKFEKISKDAKSVKLRDKIYFFENNYKELEKYNIIVNDVDNPNHLIDYGSFFRYLSEVSPEAVSANEVDIKEHIKVDLPKIMTITNFHYRYPYASIDKEEFYEKREQILRDKNYDSVHKQGILPSQQELFQLIAKILITKDTALWKPTLSPNNHWSNWESGAL